MKIIKIKTCIECPFRAVHPERKKVLKVPYCNNTGDLLPYTGVKKTIDPVAVATNVIPDWCPLSDE